MYGVLYICLSFFEKRIEISTCQAFEEVGIRGFVSDFAYDYTCMEVLQALSIPEITSLEGRTWRSGYEDPDDDTVTGLDTVV